MASSCRATPASLAEPLSAPVVPQRRRTIALAPGRHSSIGYEQMPQHINAVSRTHPAFRTESPFTNYTLSTKRTSLLHALPPADTISPTTPVEVNFAVHSAITAIHDGRPQAERIPLSAAALEMTSPHSPSAKAEHHQRIGVWRKEVADARTRRGGSAGEHKRHQRRTERSIWPVPAPASRRARPALGPTLSVVIPEHAQSQGNTKMQKSDKAMTAATPAVSRFNTTKHILPLAQEPERNKMGFISPLADDDEFGFPMTAPATTRKAFEGRPPLPHTHTSRSSSTSSSRPSYDDSDVSAYSNLSSRTSVGSSDHSQVRSRKGQFRTRKSSKQSVGTAYTVLDPTKAGVFEEPKPNFMKSLPPSPGPGPEMFSPSRSWSTNTPRAKKHDSVTSVKHNPAPEFIIRPHTRQNTSIDWKPVAVPVAVPVMVRSSKSCRSLPKLDAFDSEFNATDPYVSSTPTSPTVSEAYSELNAKLCEIKPLNFKPKPRLSTRRASPAGVTMIPGKEVPAVPRINVTRTASETSLSRVPTIPPKSARRSRRRLSFESESVISPTSLSKRNSDSSISDTSRALTLDTKAASRSKSGSDLRRDSLTQLAQLRIPQATYATPVTAKPFSSLAPRLPIISPVARLLSPCTPSARISILIPTTLDEENTASLIHRDEAWQPATPTRFNTAREAAETALLHIMASLTSLDDLSNTAVINKGMRRVYKQNELWLLKSVLHNECSAAWELREWTPPITSEATAIESAITLQQDYSAITYKSHAIRDRAVISTLKPMIVERCESFLRAETVSALKAKSDPNAARFEQAFYRIWCFCRIFGSGKHREEDITGQLDWLKGGLLAHSQGCAATVNTNLEFDMSSVLLNPPEHFGACNAGALSADDLFDMTELWNCLTTLLQPYVGKTSQARTHGIFGPAKVKFGDVEAEAVILEEWIFYVLTLGPDAVLKLAEVSSNTNSGFALAAINGWMAWTPPAANTSRGPFLREPVCRLYEERIARTPIPSTLTPKDHERKELSRKRVATLAAEIRAARCDSSYKRLPLIDMATERPMSLFSRQSGASRRTSAASSITLVAPTPPLRAVKEVPTPVTAVQASPPISAVSGSVYSRPSAGSGTGTWFSRGKISPIDSPRKGRLPPPRLEQPRPPPGRINGGRPSTDASTWANSTGVAIQNVVAMGFTPGQAREALKKTDSGDGLHVDRAVDWLLRHSP